MSPKGLRGLTAGAAHSSQVLVMTLTEIPPSVLDNSVLKCLPVASKSKIIVAHTSSWMVYMDLLVIVHKNVKMHARLQLLDLLHKCHPFWLKGKKKSATFVMQVEVLLMASLGRAGPGVKPGQRG